MSSEEAPSKPGIISNILAVAGFLILIAIVVWGAFHFLNIASSGFSSLFSRGSDNAIDISLSNRTINSGQPLDITWEHAPENGGGYALLYQCKDGFQFRGISAEGIVTGIPCGAPYAVGDSSAKTVRLVPVLGGTESADIPFSIVYTPAAATGTSTEPVERAQGSATVTVNPQADAMPMATSTLPTTGGTQTPSAPVDPAPVATPVAPAGNPDLHVRIIAVGIIDPYSGGFVNRTPTSANEVAAVMFDVANIGSGPSGTWYFTAYLPTVPATPYYSPAQRNLAPGEHIENTLRFNQVAQGGGTFSVTVDSSNTVNETNESNNYASQWVQGGYYQYQPYYPYSY